MSTVDVIKVDSDGWATVRNTARASRAWRRCRTWNRSAAPGPARDTCRCQPAGTRRPRPRRRQPPPPPPKPKPAPADDAALRQQSSALHTGARRGDPTRQPATRPPWAVASTVVAEANTNDCARGASVEQSLGRRARPRSRARWNALVLFAEQPIRGPHGRDVRILLDGLRWSSHRTPVRETDADAAKQRSRAKATVAGRSFMTAMWCSGVWLRGGSGSRRHGSGRCARQGRGRPSGPPVSWFERRSYGPR